MRKLICGRNSVKDAVLGKLPIVKILSTKELDFYVENSIEVVITDKRELDKLTNLNHQGIVAELAHIEYFGIDSIIKDAPDRVLLLDHIQDPHNFGAIIRTANSLGVKHIIIPKERAVQITNTVLKISSGGIVDMKIIRVGSLNSAVKKLKEGGFWIYATAIENGIDIKKVTFNFPMVLIVGNESKGVSKPLLKMSDQNVFIEMTGTVQSLNVSVATGIALFKTLDGQK